MRPFGDFDILRRPLARELILLAGLLAVGFLILPALVWVAGMAVLGPQAGGLGGIYDSVFGEAARGKPAAWLFAASPWLLVQSVRILFFAFRGRADSADTNET
ncbi:MAG: hypothetical protein ACREVN_05920 [Gammaproteobacteria bacterium]